jgi:hypothetical protein
VMASSHGCRLCAFRLARKLQPDPRFPAGLQGRIQAASLDVPCRGARRLGQVPHSTIGPTLQVSN